MSNIGNRSLARSTLFSGIRSFLSIAFPLITLKYASGILGPGGIGQVEFARACVSYFVLIAGLGIESFATRSGSAARGDQKDLEKFAGRVFTLNCISGAVALLLLLGTTVIVPEYRNNALLIAVFSVQIPLLVVGVEWVYYIFEDFQYIALRTVVCQIVALIAMFLFVRDASDVLIYGIILVVASYGANIFGLIYSRKYIRIKPKLEKGILQYLPPTLVLFFNQIATTVYVNSAITMMGFISNEIQIGIYSTAVKIYTAAKTLVTAILNATLPRMCYYARKENREEYQGLSLTIAKVLILIMPPSMVGIIMQSENLILLISGDGFQAAGLPLIVLALAILFSTVAMFCASTVLMPFNQEKVILKSTIVGACINVVLNFFLLPVWGGLGAAVTTLFAELAVSAVQLRVAWDKIRQGKGPMLSALGKSALGCAGIVGVNLLVGLLSLSYLVEFALAVAGSVVIYFLIQLMLKNDMLLVAVNAVKKKLHP